MVAEPVGEFADVVDTGWGLEGHLRLPVDERPLSIRLDLGIVEYGRERKRVCLSATVGCRIQVDLVTTNYIAFGSLGPQLGVTRGPIRPYVTAGLGFAYFATESRIEDVDDFDQGHFSTTNFSDFTLALTGTAGFQVQLSSGRTPVSLDLAVRYHRNGDAEYLTENDIVDEPDGSITIFPNRSDANLLTFQLGVSVGIPVGEESSG
jgi:opacity protein-like surface antigen